jgi:hypothetical protein
MDGLVNLAGKGLPGSGLSFACGTHDFAGGFSRQERDQAQKGRGTWRACRRRVLGVSHRAVGRSEVIAGGTSISACVRLA